MTARAVAAAFDYRIAEPDVGEIGERIAEALRRGELSTGLHAAAFETALGAWAGGREIVCMASGTAALEAIFEHIGVAGRTVLMPSNTFVATPNSVLRSGGSPVFLDIEPVGLGLEPGLLADAIGRFRPAAVVVVHIGGIVSPAMPEIARLCGEAGITLVEDAAHALGSNHSGRMAGSWGDFAAFSFFGTKVLATGEGGAVIAADPADAARIRRLCDHGRSEHSPLVFEAVGTNRRLGDLPALIGTTLLARFAERLALRRAHAARYDALLAAHAPRLAAELPHSTGSNFYKYIVRTGGADSGALTANLRARGVLLPGSVYAIPCHRQPALSACLLSGPLRQTERFCSRHLCLPLYPALSPDAQLAIVTALAETVAAAVRGP